MSYRVLWTPEAESQLEAIVSNSDEKQRFLKIAAGIDRSLHVDPIGFGESRTDTLRIGFARPLGIQYDVLEDVATVVVYDVWRVATRSQ